MTITDKNEKDEYEELPVKKLIVLFVSIAVLVALLLPHFFGKSKPPAESDPAQEGVSVPRLPVPNNLKELPPKLQEYFLKRNRPTE